MNFRIKVILFDVQKFHNFQFFCRNPKKTKMYSSTMPLKISVLPKYRQILKK